MTEKAASIVDRGSRDAVECFLECLGVVTGAGDCNDWRERQFSWKRVKELLLTGRQSISAADSVDSLLEELMRLALDSAEGSTGLQEARAEFVTTWEVMSARLSNEETSHCLSAAQSWWRGLNVRSVPVRVRQFATSVLAIVGYLVMRRTHNDFEIGEECPPSEPDETDNRYLADVPRSIKWELNAKCAFRP